MNRTDDLTRRLMNLAHRPTAEGPERDELERAFAAIVRLALRTGQGLPHVVQWVRQTHERLAGPRSMTAPVQFAPRITHILFDQILDRLRPSADTHPNHWAESVKEG
jgi:hypothetical protein